MNSGLETGKKGKPEAVTKSQACRDRRTFQFFGVLAAAAVLASPSWGSAQEKPVHWQIDPLPEKVYPGVWTTLRVHASIDSPWHLYSLTQPRPPIATVISVGPAHLLRGGRARQPVPTNKYDPNFEIRSELFSGKVLFEIPVVVPDGTKPGEHEAFVAVLFQTCTETVCLPPARDTFSVTLNVVTPPPGVQIRGVPTEPGLEDATGRGLLDFLALAALMGGFALLTPCVFPMIPITVSYFTRRHQGAKSTRGRAEITRDAAIYGGGIIIAFSALGLLLALVFGATGINRFAANPWVNLLVASLFIGFALDLLGVYEFRLPWRVLTKLQGNKERGGATGLLLMGVVFAVTTFTCTVPFVGTLLVAASRGAWAWPIIGMLAFSTVFALPFFVLALVPQLLNRMPKGGSWMGALKVTLGLIELGAAFKFLSNADLVWEAGFLHRPVVIAIWVGLSALISLYLLGHVKLATEIHQGDRTTIGIPRLLAGGAFVALTAFLASGLVEKPLGEFEAFLPPHSYPGEESSFRTSDSDSRDGGLSWFSTYEDGLAEAKATARPLFVDFTGYTCTNCRWMEANVFTRSDIKELFGNYVLVRLYTDGRGDKYVRNRDFQLRRFGTIAMPLYVILGPDGETLSTLSGLTRKSQRFADFLRAPLKAIGSS